jgi:putative pyoverdin transport system ATP-binding/permease protein
MLDDSFSGTTSAIVTGNNSKITDRSESSNENNILSTTNLSQGQKKRLALLTAYLEDRPIYLFDEWASDQDPNFRHIFYTSILPKLHKSGKTVISIGHDDRYFHLADRLIKLDYGKIEFDQANRSDDRIS